MEATWGVATPKGFGNCCNVRRKPRPSQDRSSEKVSTISGFCICRFLYQISVLRSDHLHYCSTCVLHLLSETPGDLVLEEVMDRDDVGCCSWEDFDSSSVVSGSRGYFEVAESCVPSGHRPKCFNCEPLCNRVRWVKEWQVRYESICLEWKEQSR